MTRPPRKDLPKPAVDVGKRVGGSLYVHKDALHLLGDLADRVTDAERLADAPDWNVAKIEKISVSLLLYESFDVEFPALLESVKVALPRGKITHISYAKRANPPILHRKELLLPPDDARLPRFRALTRAAEDAGLFARPNRIGTRNAWNSLIEGAGLAIHKGRLIPIEEDKIDVARHRTAIVRRDLSQPMQLMMRFGIVTKERSLFDYGCGQGEDVAALNIDGYRAFGWDPHHASNAVRAPADIVNLGFVLNVIEDARERVETLKAAWQFAEKALCVAVMRYVKVSTIGWKPYRDGVLTSRGTFQKYFHQQELHDFVAAATGQKPLALAPGIVVVFRDKDLEQEVLLRRHSRALMANAALPRPPPRPKPSLARSTLRQRVASVVDTLREIALHLGRIPDFDEAPQEAMEILRAQHIAWPRAIELLREDLAACDTFHASAATRRNDLLVHLALMQFPGAPSYRSLPKSLQADIKAFFRSHSTAVDEGRRALFAAGDRGALRQDILDAVAARLGGMRGDQWFRFRSAILHRLPRRIRVLVGCAEVLQGGVDACDFVDVDLNGARIAMVTCDSLEDFVPSIIERVTVDLARQKVSANKFEPHEAPLYFKSRYLPPDEETSANQAKFEEALTRTGLFRAVHGDPPWAKVKAAIRKR